MQITNTTNIPTKTIREIIQFVKPNGVTKYDVMVKNSSSAWAGRAYYQGSSFHHTSNHFIVVRIGGDKHFPIKRLRYKGHKTSPTYWINSRIEALVMLLAHELRHLWQYGQYKKRHKVKSKRGYYKGVRGYFSEVDAELFTYEKLKAWRAKQ